MEKILIFCLLCSLLTTSCNRKVNNELIIDFSNEKAIINSNFKIKLFPKTTDFNIQRAYLKCDMPFDSIDISTGRVKGCHLQLEVKNDTVLFSFTPTIVGENYLKDVKIICENQENMLFSIDTTISYMVVE